MEAEVRQGIAFADAAKAAGIEHLVYSSVGSADRGRVRPRRRIQRGTQVRDGAGHTVEFIRPPRSLQVSALDVPVDKGHPVAVVVVVPEPRNR